MSEDDVKKYVYFTEIPRSKGSLIYRFEIHPRRAFRIRIETLDILCESLMTLAKSWCADQFGPQGMRWKKSTHLRIVFRDERDAVAFKMRWS